MKIDRIHTWLLSGFALCCANVSAENSTPPPQLLPVTEGLFLDLDANHGTELEDGHRVKAWHNQVKGNAADVFIKRDEGRKAPGSGRPTLKKDHPLIGGHSTLIFEEQELINMDEDAFDHLSTGSGYTWISVMCAYKQNVGKKDVNSFFGNLRNGNPYDGFWGNLMDDNVVWMGTRNGISPAKGAKKKGKAKIHSSGRGTPGLWNDTLNPLVMSKEPLKEKQYYIIMGRMGSGQQVVQLDLFINSSKPVDSKPVPVNTKANPSMMAVGQERDATNHPGFESFHGEITRFLIYERPLNTAELEQVLQSLSKTYSIPLSQ